MNFYESWIFLRNHKMFNESFSDDLWMEVVMVNPNTNEIDNTKEKNTKIQVWLEHGPYNKDIRACEHDYDLDCGGDTFENAIIELAKLVKKYYNEDGTKNRE